MEPCRIVSSTVFRTSSSVTTLTKASSWGFLAARERVPLVKPSDPGKYMLASPDSMELRELRLGSTGRWTSPTEHTGAARDKTWARMHCAVLVDFMLDETPTRRD